MKLAIVLPTLNEARHLAFALESLPGEAETVVSDGGSVDETLAIASRYGARIVSGDKGRGAQMNRGAWAAEGDVLLFLHADCRLGPDAGREMRAALEDPTVVGGAFRLELEGAGAGLRFAAGASNLRARYLKTPYGDQGLFLRRSVFEAIGGFPEIAFMEDVAMVRHLRKYGKLVRLDATVTTGTRHWESLGALGTTLLNWSMVSLFLLGVSAERLAPFYRRLRGPGPPAGAEARELS